MDWMKQATDFMPHGMCLLWRPDLMALHIGSDALIAAAYFAIPVTLTRFVRRRRDLIKSHRWIALLFAAFITLCGLTHIASILVLWQPVYLYEGLLKALTAVASLGTAAFLPFLIPRLLAIPSPMALQREVDAHRATLQELELARSTLAARVDRTEDELRAANRRFEASIKNSTITLFEQTDELIYTWAYNTPLGLRPEDLVGRSELDLFSTESAQAVRALKLDCLAADAPRRGEVSIEANGQRGWFDISVEPLMLADGRRGLIATSTDVTLRREYETELEIMTREMNHRAKNILAMVMGLVRQTARSFEVPGPFKERLTERLMALAQAHDVLAHQRWRGADLILVLQGQLHHHLQAFGERIAVAGPECTLPAESAHYVGLALHELGSNAIKHGALARPEGKVHISWTVDKGAAGGEQLTLVWAESGVGALAAQPSQGFGMSLLNSLVARGVQGRSETTFGPDGLIFTLTAPVQTQSATLSDRQKLEDRLYG